MGSNTIGTTYICVFGNYLGLRSRHATVVVFVKSDRHHSTAQHGFNNQQVSIVIEVNATGPGESCCNDLIVISRSY